MNTNNQLEFLRKKMVQAYIEGNFQRALFLSKELDVLILQYQN